MTEETGGGGSRPSGPAPLGRDPTAGGRAGGGPAGREPPEREQAGWDGAERERPGEPLLNLPPVVALLILLMGGIHLLRMHGLSPEQDFGLIVRAAFVPAFYSGAYAFDVWSLSAPFTYTLLHGDWVHFGVNAVWLAAFGSPLAARLGVGRFLLFWAVSGLAAAGLHFALHPFSDAPLIGASGSIAGMMGAAARFGFRSQRTAGGAVFAGPPLSLPDTFRSRGVLVFLVIWMAVNAVTGLAGSVPGVSGQIAWEAHVGGFLLGFLGLGMFLPRGRASA